jgi:hypothetical protein
MRFGVKALFITSLAAAGFSKEVPAAAQQVANDATAGKGVLDPPDPGVLLQILFRDEGGPVETTLSALLKHLSIQLPSGFLYKGGAIAYADGYLADFVALGPGRLFLPSEGETFDYFVDPEKGIGVVIASGPEGMSGVAISGAEGDLLTGPQVEALLASWITNRTPGNPTSAYFAFTEAQCACMCYEWNHSAYYSQGWIADCQCWNGPGIHFSWSRGDHSPSRTGDAAAWVICQNAV